MNRTSDIIDRAAAVKQTVAVCTSEEKNRALTLAAEAILSDKKTILEKNLADLDNARGKIPDSMLDRLLLTEKRIDGMADGIRQVIALPDPAGIILSESVRPNGLKISKVSVPMGVIAIIYESRPNVTSDAAVLALKAGSACILRSGREAHGTSAEIVRAMREGISAAGLPADAVQIIDDVSRDSANEIMRAHGKIDLLIPRGGKRLIQACVENATVPVLETGTGICHVYVDRYADVDKALNIIENAKCSRPSVCNAEEVCLVNRHIARDFLPLLKKRLVDDREKAGLVSVKLILDPQAAEIIDGVPAGDGDFDREFLDYTLAVAVVEDTEEAVRHISLHSTRHSDAIISEKTSEQELFVKGVDSAAVYVNASTRFTDGGEFGLGCEMGISTQKLHARGPVGLQELCSYKYIIRGDGQTR